MSLITVNEELQSAVTMNRVQSLKSKLPRKYSPANADLLQTCFQEYKMLIHELIITNPETRARLQSNLYKLQQRVNNMEQPGNSIAASRYYFNEVVSYMTIELINVGHLFTNAE